MSASPAGGSVYSDILEPATGRGLSWKENYAELERYQRNETMHSDQTEIPGVHHDSDSSSDSTDELSTAEYFDLSEKDMTVDEIAADLEKKMTAAIVKRADTADAEERRQVAEAIQSLRATVVEQSRVEAQKMADIEKRIRETEAEQSRQAAEAKQRRRVARRRRLAAEAEQSRVEAQKMADMEKRIRESEAEQRRIVAEAKQTLQATVSEQSRVEAQKMADMAKRIQETEAEQRRQASDSGWSQDAKVWLQQLMRNRGEKIPVTYGGEEDGKWYAGESVVDVFCKRSVWTLGMCQPASDLVDTPCRRSGVSCEVDAKALAETLGNITQAVLIGQPPTDFYPAIHVWLFELSFLLKNNVKLNRYNIVEQAVIAYQKTFDPQMPDITPQSSVLSYADMCLYINLILGLISREYAPVASVDKNSVTQWLFSKKSFSEKRDIMRGLVSVAHNRKGDGQWGFTRLAIAGGLVLTVLMSGDMITGKTHIAQNVHHVPGYF